MTVFIRTVSVQRERKRDKVDISLGSSSFIIMSFFSYANQQCYSSIEHLEMLFFANQIAFG